MAGEQRESDSGGFPGDVAAAAPTSRPGSAGGGGGNGGSSGGGGDGSDGAEQASASSQQQGQGGIEVAALRSMSTTRVAKFQRLLDEQIVDLEALRELAWSGVPPGMRALCWRLLLGYLPPSRERRSQVLGRRRAEYRNLLPEYYDRAAAAGSDGAALGLRSEEEEGALRQVAVDVPRTAPGVPFFHQPQVQKSLERILYIWGLRHPASGYVQGINDLVTPFMAVFVSEHFPAAGPNDLDAWDASALSQETLLDVEADCYWCLCKLLDGIQDHYTYAQPGIQRTVFHVRELVGRVEAPVLEHLESEGLEFIQFAFRWVNCLLLRELPFALGLRLWDTYLAEGSQLREFLAYVLAAFLLSWPDQLRSLEFQELIMFLQARFRKPCTIATTA
eukprot:scaffold2.g6931.t1